MILVLDPHFDSVPHQRVEQGAILGYAGIARGESITPGQLNDAYQKIVASGLFESVEIEPRGGTLVITVKEYPTINRISIEGNRRLKDDALIATVQSKERFVYSPNQAERDAAEIANQYNASGRVAARVTPKIIRRSSLVISALRILPMPPQMELSVPKMIRSAPTSRTPAST